MIFGGDVAGHSCHAQVSLVTMRAAYLESGQLSADVRASAFDPVPQEADRHLEFLEGCLGPPSNIRVTPPSQHCVGRPSHSKNNQPFGFSAASLSAGQQLTFSGSLSLANRSFLQDENLPKAWSPHQSSGRAGRPKFHASTRSHILAKRLTLKNAYRLTRTAKLGGLRLKPRKAKS